MEKFDVLKIIKHTIDDSNFGKQAYNAWDSFDEYDLAVWGVIEEIGKALENLFEEE